MNCPLFRPSYRITSRFEHLDQIISSANGKRRGGAQSRLDKCRGGLAKCRDGLMTKHMGVTFGSSAHCVYAHMVGHTLGEDARACTIQEPKLLFVPDGLDNLFIGHSNACTTTHCLPLSLALDAKTVKRLVDGGDQPVHLLDGVSGGWGNAETFFTHSDSGVVDRLDIDTVIDEKRVRGSLGQSSITDKNGHDVRGAGTEKTMIRHI